MISSAATDSKIYRFVVFHVNICVRVHNQLQQITIIDVFEICHDRSLVSHQYYSNVCTVNRRMIFDSILLNVCAARATPAKFIAINKMEMPTINHVTGKVFVRYHSMAALARIPIPKSDIMLTIIE